MTDELADPAARQSAPTTGTAADKEREEKELETAAFTALTRDADDTKLSS